MLTHECLFLSCKLSVRITRLDVVSVCTADPRYLTNEAMHNSAEACHTRNMSFSVYNTMRELSNRCVEYWAMLSFNRTLVPGNGGGADWLQEHIHSQYLPAWSNPVRCVGGI